MFISDLRLHEEVGNDEKLSRDGEHIVQMDCSVGNVYSSAAKYGNSQHKTKSSTQTNSMPQTKASTHSIDCVPKVESSSLRNTDASSTPISSKVFDDESGTSNLAQPQKHFVSNTGGISQYTVAGMNVETTPIQSTGQRGFNSGETTKHVKLTFDLKNLPGQYFVSALDGTKIHHSVTQPVIAAASVNEQSGTVLPMSLQVTNASKDISPALGKLQSLVQDVGKVTVNSTAMSHVNSTATSRACTASIPTGSEAHGVKNQQENKQSYRASTDRPLADLLEDAKNVLETEKFRNVVFPYQSVSKTQNLGNRQENKGGIKRSDRPLADLLEECNREAEEKMREMLEGKKTERLDLGNVAPKNSDRRQGTAIRKGDSLQQHSEDARVVNISSNKQESHDAASLHKSTDENGNNVLNPMYSITANIYQQTANYLSSLNPHTKANVLSLNSNNSATDLNSNNYTMESNSNNTAPGLNSNNSAAGSYGWNSNNSAVELNSNNSATISKQQTSVPASTSAQQGSNAAWPSNSDVSNQSVVNPAPSVLMPSIFRPGYYVLLDNAQPEISNVSTSTAASVSTAPLSTDPITSLPSLNFHQGSSLMSGGFSMPSGGALPTYWSIPICVISPSNYNSALAVSMACNNNTTQVQSGQGHGSVHEGQIQGNEVKDTRDKIRHPLLKTPPKKIRIEPLKINNWKKQKQIKPKKSAKPRQIKPKSTLTRSGSITDIKAFSDKLTIPISSTENDEDLALSINVLDRSQSAVQSGQIPATPQSAVLMRTSTPKKTGNSIGAIFQSSNADEGIIPKCSYDVTRAQTSTGTVLQGPNAVEDIKAKRLSDGSVLNVMTKPDDESVSLGSKLLTPPTISERKRKILGLSSGTKRKLRKKLAETSKDRNGNLVGKAVIKVKETLVPSEAITMSRSPCSEIQRNREGGLGEGNQDVKPKRKHFYPKNRKPRTKRPHAKKVSNGFSNKTTNSKKNVTQREGNLHAQGKYCRVKSLHGFETNRLAKESKLEVPLSHHGTNWVGNISESNVALPSSRHNTNRLAKELNVSESKIRFAGELRAPEVEVSNGTNQLAKELRLCGDGAEKGRNLCQLAKFSVLGDRNYFLVLQTRQP